MSVHNVVGTGSDTTSTTDMYNKDLRRAASAVPLRWFGVLDHDCLLRPEGEAFGTMPML
jgi:hypothetical protein